MSEEYRTTEPPQREAGPLFQQPPSSPHKKPVQLQAPETAAEKERYVLVRLRTEGHVSCVSMDRDPHRGQATVRRLRELGYDIATVMFEGARHYRLDGFAQMVEVSDEMKKAYYQTDHWQMLSESRRVVDDYRCQHCRSAESLEVHHWCYELFAEAIEDLSTYCRTCHERFHGHITGSQIHFPRTVTPGIARRLGWDG